MKIYNFVSDAKKKDVIAVMVTWGFILWVCTVSKIIRMEMWLNPYYMQDCE